MPDYQPWSPPEHLPRWVWKAVAIFWLGYILAIVTRSLWTSLSALSLLLLVSLFLSLAIEPGVNRLAARGWRRGTATDTGRAGGPACGRAGAGAGRVPRRLRAAPAPGPAGAQRSAGHWGLEPGALGRSA